MSQDGAILAAAFALRDREGPVSPVAEKLRAFLPATLTDVAEENRSALEDEAIAVIAEDPDELAWFRAAVTGFKSFGSISPMPLLEVYKCPQGDYRWTRPNASYKVPQCPTHRVALELA